MMFFVSCMTNFKKLSIFELLCINYSPNLFVDEKYIFQKKIDADLTYCILLKCSLFTGIYKTSQDSS